MAEIIKANTAWRRSSYTGDTNCVEVLYGALIRIRDSKRPGEPQLGVSTAAWSALIGRLRTG